MKDKADLRFLGSELDALSPEEALFHIIPVPYEKTVSYGTGTAQGPSAILQASQQLELFDGKGCPADLGIYTYPSLPCSGDAQAVLVEISSAVSRVLELGKIPILLGGEHSVTLGALRALRQENRSFGVVQFDAHADLRDSYEGSRYSHACVMRRLLEMDINLFQVGVRSLSWEEELLRRQFPVSHLDAWEIAEMEEYGNILPNNFPKDIYLTIDIDVLDPSIMPATGTPEPGGLLWYQMMKLLAAVIKDRTILGFDVVELAPAKGMHAADFTAARMIYNLFGMIQRNATAE